MARRNRKPDADQLPLDFDARKREIAERCQLVEAIDYRRSGLSRTRWRHVAGLLKAIACCSGPDGYSDAYADTLAERCEVSRRTLFRARSDAVALDLVEIVPTHDHRGRDRNRWRVRWDRVARIGIDRGAGTGATSECQCVPTWHGVSAKLARGECQVGTANRNNTPLSSDSNSPPPPPHAPAPDTAPPRRRTGSPEWEVVVEEVSRCGVGQAAKAVGIARRHGATVEDVRELVAWWREHKGQFEYPEVVLYRRVQRASPELAADDGWPPPAAGYVDPAEDRERREEARRKLLWAKHRETIEAWSPEFKQAYGDQVARQYAIERSDTRAILDKIYDQLESRELYESTLSEGVRRGMQ